MSRDESNLSRRALINLLNKGELFCACAQEPATITCVQESHLLLDDTTRKIVNSRLSWEDS